MRRCTAARCRRERGRRVWGGRASFRRAQRRPGRPPRIAPAAGGPHPRAPDGPPRAPAQDPAGFWAQEAEEYFWQKKARRPFARRRRARRAVCFATLSRSREPRPPPFRGSPARPRRGVGAAPWPVHPTPPRRPPPPHAAARRAAQWEPDHHTYNFDLSRGRIGVTWFKGGRTNITFNCLDRWVGGGRGRFGGREGGAFQGQRAGRRRPSEKPPRPPPPSPPTSACAPAGGSYRAPAVGRASCRRATTWGTRRR
jgi:hypothetical protein